MARNHKQEFNDLTADRRLLKAMHTVSKDHKQVSERTYQETLKGIDQDIDEVLDDYNKGRKRG